MDDSKLYEAWEEAAKDLNLTIRFPIKKERNGMGILILHFGSPKGTIVTGFETGADFKVELNKGYYFSQLDKTYENYDRSLFIDTLNDWGYFGGSENKPKWYSFKPWNE